MHNQLCGSPMRSLNHAYNRKQGTPTKTYETYIPAVIPALLLGPTIYHQDQRSSHGKRVQSLQWSPLLIYAQRLPHRKIRASAASEARTAIIPYFLSKKHYSRTAGRQSRSRHSLERTVLLFSNVGSGILSHSPSLPHTCSCILPAGWEDNGANRISCSLSTTTPTPLPNRLICPKARHHPSPEQHTPRPQLTGPFLH